PATAVGLELGDLWNVTDDPQLAHESESATFEIGISPSETQDLATAHPGHQSHIPNEVETLLLSLRKERGDLVGRPGCLLGSPPPALGGGHESVIGDIAHYPSPPDCVREGAVKDRVTVLDRPRAQSSATVQPARFSQGCVEVRQV